MKKKTTRRSNQTTLRSCAVLNQSARRLTPVEEEGIFLGLNFAVVPNKISKKEVIQHLEPKLINLKDNIASTVRV